MDLQGKTVVVVGLGHSGVSAAKLCARRGAEVVATDKKPLDELSEAARGLPARVMAGGHDGVPFADADLIVVSPGVPLLPELDAAKNAGVPVIGELELGWRLMHRDAPLVAVGGTNGKSTVTTLIECMARDAKLQTFCGGNLGTPLTDAVGGEYDLVVVEVSSFQLERAPSFRPRVAVLLNVSEDHLDRYPSFAAYADAKGNAFAHQYPSDIAVIPSGDAVCEQQARRGQGRVVRFGPGGDYIVEDDAVLERSTGESFSLEGSELHGAHNALNAAAAVAAARGAGLARSSVGSGLLRFKALPHRMARVAKVGNVSFYDDSKATNVGAAVTALLGLGEPKGVLIAGGRDKLGAYDQLVSALAQKGRAAVLIGEAADRIARAIGDQVVVERASSMDDAVARAFRLAQPGDAVLLSPACSSYDMFQSYAERGDRFAEAVRTLQGQHSEVSK